MNLLGQRLSDAQIEFTSASCKHTQNGIKDVEIIVVDEANKKKCEEWLAFVKNTDHQILDATVRVATAEELERYKRLQEMA